MDQKRIITFLRQVMANNNREWFQEHKKEYEAAGHCAAYTFNGEDIFICHGYSVALDGASVLVMRRIDWTKEEWPKLAELK